MRNLIEGCDDKFVYEREKREKKQCRPFEFEKQNAVTITMNPLTPKKVKSIK